MNMNSLVTDGKSFQPLSVNLNDVSNYHCFEFKTIALNSQDMNNSMFSGYI